MSAIPNSLLEKLNELFDRRLFLKEDAYRLFIGEREADKAPIYRLSGGADFLEIVCAQHWEGPICEFQKVTLVVPSHNAAFEVIQHLVGNFNVRLERRPAARAGAILGVDAFGSLPQPMHSKTN